MSPNHVRVYFPLANQYYMASCWTQDKTTKTRSYLVPDGGVERMLIPAEEGEGLVQKGTIFFDASMAGVATGYSNPSNKLSMTPGLFKGGKAISPLSEVEYSKIKINITPSGETGVIRIGWNTLIGYSDSSAPLIKTASTVINGDFGANTLLQLCALTAYGKLVINEIECDATAEGVYAAAAPKYKRINHYGENILEKKLPFPQANSKDTDNTIRVFDAKYLSDLGVKLEFGGKEYLEFTVPDTFAITLSLVIEFHPRG